LRQNKNIWGTGMMSQNTIAMKNVSFRYSSRQNEEIIKGLEFSSKPGEFVCLLGPSGCGKTTVLRLLAGFQRPSGGEIKVNDKIVERPGKDRAVVFQGDDSLFDWLTANDNVAFGLRMQGMARKDYQPIVSRYLTMVGLAGHGHKYPAELSGGMRQRIQIARVLANNPEILLMDEPFGALDAQTRTELQDELIRIWSETKKSVLFITHDIAEAIVLSDRIGIMSSGPGSRIKELIEVDLPRPRTRSNQKFGELYELISKLIHDQVKTKHER
jgi:NitT/TauT family transport system ATP-binding protein